MLNPNQKNEDRCLSHRNFIISSTIVWIPLPTASDIDLYYTDLGRSLHSLTDVSVVRRQEIRLGLFSIGISPEDTLTTPLES